MTRQIKYKKVGDYIVPLAASLNKDSHLYCKSIPEWGEHIAVTLDGVVQDQVVAFDVEEGWVRRYCLKDGEPYIRRDEIATEYVRGNVELQLKEPA